MAFCVSGGTEAPILPELANLLLCFFKKITAAGHGSLSHAVVNDPTPIGYLGRP